MGKRRQAREYCLQVLYLADTGMTGGELDRAFLESAAALDEETRVFGRAMYEGAIAALLELDTTIEKFATNWRIGRMPAVDRCILRMAVYELVKNPQTPPLAVIDEAIELAKRFSTENSGAFVNGILDRVRMNPVPAAPALPPAPPQTPTA
jgi:N utilization substance protein B